jgi:uncharacterized membrane protein YjjP (DUF1212 family)
MQSEDLLLFAADAARAMLENGGETYRAEDVAMSIIACQGGMEAECFATSTGLMLSFMGADGRVRSVVRRIKKRGMNLERVSRIDRMVRDLATDTIGIDDASRELDVIERSKDNPWTVKALASAAGAGFFTLLFGGNALDALVAAGIGAMVAFLSLGIIRLHLPDFLISLAGGALAAGASLSLHAYGVAIDVNLVIIGVIMLLVPGVAITNAIRDTIAGDLVAGLARGADAFLTAAAISAGAGGAFTLWQLLQKGGL